MRSYVVEEPVSADVQLRDERVQVERRPVDRPLAAGEDAFVDRTIEAEEHTEEAVVGKEARVTEEIGLRRESEERTETSPTPSAAPRSRSRTSARTLYLIAAAPDPVRPWHRGRGRHMPPSSSDFPRWVHGAFALNRGSDPAAMSSGSP